MKTSWHVPFSSGDLFSKPGWSLRVVLTSSTVPETGANYILGVRLYNPRDVAASTYDVRGGFYTLHRTNLLCTISRFGGSSIKMDIRHVPPWAISEPA